MTKFRIVLLLVTAQLFFSCIPVTPKSVKPELKPMPSFEIDPGTLDFMKKMFVCDKADSEMALADFNDESSAAVEGTETLREVETTDCDGKVEKSISLVEHFKQSIDISPDKDLSQQLNFMSVENVRTCATIKISAVEKAKFEVLKDEKLLPDSTSFGKDSIASIVGDAQIVLFDSPIKMEYTDLNVSNGNNVLKIRYFGKCLKYAEKIDDTKTDSKNCLEAEVLAEKQIFLKVSITRKVSPLPALKVNSCKTNPTPQAK